MIRNRSSIFSVDRGINRKMNGKLLQQCATRIDGGFRPFLVDTSINRKNIWFISSIRYNEYNESKLYLIGPQMFFFLMFQTCILPNRLLKTLRLVSYIFEHIYKSFWVIVCLLNCLEFFVPLENFTHMETSPLQVESGLQIWSMLSTRGHWAVRVL